MNLAKDLGQSRGFDIHGSKCGNGAGLDFKCLPLLLLSGVGDRDLSAVHSGVIYQPTYPASL